MNGTQTSLTGIAVVLTVIFAILKFAGPLAAWPWLAVFAPLLILAALVILFVAFIGLGVLIGVVIAALRK